MIRNIIFDIGMVLVDFRPAGCLEDMGYSKEDARAILDATIDSGLWVELDRGAVPEQEIIAQMKKKVPAGLEDAFDRFFEDGKENFVRVFPESAEWLADCKRQGLNVYILSNYPVSYFESHKKKFDFLEYADGQVVSAYVKMIKPDEEIYRYLLDQYGLKAEECIFVDDRGENIEGAEKVGIHGVLFTSREQAKKEIAELMAE